MTHTTSGPPVGWIDTLGLKQIFSIFSAVLYHECCIQDGSLFPRFSLLLLTLLLPGFTTHALLPIFQEESWVLEWIRIRVDVEIFESERNNCGFILNPDTCVRGLNERLDGLSPREPLLSGIQACGQAPQRACARQVHQYKLCKWYLR